MGTTALSIVPLLLGPVQTSAYLVADPQARVAAVIDPAKGISQLPVIDPAIPEIIKESLSEDLDKYDLVTGEKISDNKKRVKKTAADKE